MQNKWNGCQAGGFVAYDRGFYGVSNAAGGGG